MSLECVKARMFYYRDRRDLPVDECSDEYAEDKDLFYRGRDKSLEVRNRFEKAYLEMAEPIRTPEEAVGQIGSRERPYLCNGRHRDSILNHVKEKYGRTFTEQCITVLHREDP